MTVKYDPAEIERLCREAREAILLFDPDAPPSSETSSSRYVEGWNDALDKYLEPLACQLEAARAEVERLADELRKWRSPCVDVGPAASTWICSTCKDPNCGDV